MISLDAKEEMGLAADDYASQMTSEVAQYLIGRGITREAAIAHKIGYVGTPRIGHERYRGRLTIPYITPTCVSELRFRSIDGTEPKYLSRDGAETHLYNVGAFHVDSDVIAICEGEFDAMILNSVVGCIPAIGLAGANAWKPMFRRAFTDYHRVYVLTDGDQAGSDLGKKIATAIDVAVVVSMPPGMDVSDVFLAEGAEGIKGRLGI